MILPFLTVSTLRLINGDAALRSSLPVSAIMRRLYPDYVSPWQRSLQSPKTIPVSKAGSVQTYRLELVDPLYIDRGLKVWDAGRRSEAIAILKEGFINGGEEAADGRFTLVFALMFNGQYNEALQWAATGVDENANEIMHTTLATLLAETGQASPDTIFYARGQIARMYGSFATEQFAYLPPQNDASRARITMWFVQASAFEIAVGMEDWAGLAWRRVLELDPSQPEAAIRIGGELLAKPALPVGEKREVAKMLKRAMGRATHGRGYRRLWNLLCQADKPAALAMPTPQERP